jgi:hypothetical protein
MPARRRGVTGTRAFFSSAVSSGEVDGPPTGNFCLSSGAPRPISKRGRGISPEIETADVGMTNH